MAVSQSGSAGEHLQRPRYKPGVTLVVPCAVQVHRQQCDLLRPRAARVTEGAAHHLVEAGCDRVIEEMDMAKPRHRARLPLDRDKARPDLMILAVRLPMRDVPARWPRHIHINL